MNDKNLSCEQILPHENTVSSLRDIMPDGETFEAGARFFKALSDPTRTKIIWALDQSELCVCDLSELLNMTPSAISHQLSGLKKDRMVKSRREGKEIFYSLSDGHISAMLESGIAHTKERQ